MMNSATSGNIQAADLTRAFELASRLVHSRSHVCGLYPAQWSALRYFKTASGEYRTAIALARYQGLAFGPVARTVRTLVERGFLRKAGSAGRGRAEVVELTAAGEAILARDPLAPLLSAIVGLDPKVRAAFASALEPILEALAGAGEAEDPASWPVERQDIPRNSPKND
jgi:DNA-binding MarR family transcriptional regulator